MGIVFPRLFIFSLCRLAFLFLLLLLLLLLKKKVWKGFWERFGGVLELYRGRVAAEKHPRLMLTRVYGFFWTCLGLVKTWLILDPERGIASRGLV